MQVLSPGPLINFVWLIVHAMNLFIQNTIIQRFIENYGLIGLKPLYF